MTYHQYKEKKVGDAVFIYLHPASGQLPLHGTISRIEKDEAIVIWHGPPRQDVPRRMKLMTLISE